jgi:hypothetical protein
MAATRPSPQEFLAREELLELWPILDPEEQVKGFLQLGREAAEPFFLARAAAGQAMLILGISEGERRGWMRLLAPDDAADVLQECLRSGGPSFSLCSTIPRATRCRRCSPTLRTRQAAS